MSNNSNGYIAVNKSNAALRESMDLFDSFSPEIRLILSEAYYNVTIKPGRERLFKRSRLLKETLKNLAKDSALKTYGSNYPLDTI